MARRRGRVERIVKEDGYCSNCRRDGVRVMWNRELSAFRCDECWPREATAKQSQETEDYNNYWASLVERHYGRPPAELQAEPAPTGEPLADFEVSARFDRSLRHRELDLFAQNHPLENLEERHRLIDEMEPWESKAFEMLARGVDPGPAAVAFVDQFIANAYGDPWRGLPHPDPEPEVPEG